MSLAIQDFAYTYAKTAAHGLIEESVDISYPPLLWERK
jgi:hypothetical protein